MDQFNWDDIEPLAIEDTSTTGQPQLCQILYSDDYKLVMGYLRRLMSLEEYSDRALYITQEAISMVASHYTVWQYRYHIVKALEKDILKELEWCDEVAVANQKNYQIWHYRQLLISLYESNHGEAFDPKNESPLIETMLIEDNKNYHVWSYKTWLAQKFQLYKTQFTKEMGFVNKMLSIDVRNNSAWNYRYFLIVHQENLAAGVDDHDLRNEIQFVKDAIDLAPQNESPWNYLQGLYAHFDGLEISELKPLCLKYADITTTPKEKNGEEEEETEIEPIVQSTHAMEILAKINEQESEGEILAKHIYSLLATKYDPIRANYWKYRISQIV